MLILLSMPWNEMGSTFSWGSSRYIQIFRTDDVGESCGKDDVVESFGLGIGVFMVMMIDSIPILVARGA